MNLWKEMMFWSKIAEGNEMIGIEDFHFKTLRLLLWMIGIVFFQNWKTFGNFVFVDALDGGLCDDCGMY